MKIWAPVLMALAGVPAFAQQYDYHSHSVPTCRGVLVEFQNSDETAQCRAIADAYREYSRCRWEGSSSSYTVTVTTDSYTVVPSGNATYPDHCKVTTRITRNFKDGTSDNLFEYPNHPIHKRRVVTVAPPITPDPPNTCVPQHGNPIFPLTGSKREMVALPGLPGLPLRLSYDTRRKLPSSEAGVAFTLAGPVSFGELWESSLHRRLLVESVGGTPRVQVARGLGVWVTFKAEAGGYVTSPHVRDRLVSHSNGWRYHDVQAQAIESYSTAGQLLEIRYATGRKLSFTYSDASTPATVAPVAGLLIKVEDQFGRSRQFTYEKPASALLPLRITRVVDLGSQTTQFAYDVAGNLSQITWPDLTTRKYLYENPALPWALTGIVDERSVRVSTFGYDAEGRATSTERAGGVGRYTASWTTKPSLQSSSTYDGATNTIFRSYSWATPQGTSVTGPDGQSVTYGASSTQGAPSLSTTSQPAGAGCAAATSSQVLDAQGNPTQRDDFTGLRTCYGHDLSRNLETVRVDGLSKTQACSAVTPVGATLPSGSRKTSTQWHPDWRLAVKVAEPKRLTTHVYNGQPDPFAGNAIASCAPATAKLPDGKPIAVLCKTVEQATYDGAGGAGFAAALDTSVASRNWSYTYNEFGQVLTVRDPRGNVTTSTYYGSTTADYTRGDLEKTTNALGQVTGYPKYSAAGQVLKSIDANGVATDFEYDSRQRLKTQTTAGQATVYAYTPSGLLERVTQPDGSFISYEYDGAQRLKAMQDKQGNRIEYTLDDSGRRREERVKDPAGVLKRQVNRVFDALGRTQQVTGRE